MPASATLSLRISPQDRNLIDRVAQVTNKSRTEFLLDSARAAATDTLLDQRLFMLNAKQFKAFEKALEAAPSTSELIQELKKRPSPWKS